MVDSIISTLLYVVAPCLEMPEAATADVLQEGVFLEILQNSQENTHTKGESLFY